MVLYGKLLIKKTKNVVALKKIFDAFQNSTDAQRTYREIMFLQEFSTHDNIIKLLGVHKADNDKDIYLVFEFMETDLHAVIRGNILEEIHKRYIIYQLLKALKYMHTGEVLHRDLKPSNLLLNSECLMKVADFGLARSVASLMHKDEDNQEENPVLTEYVATRWYRAPEILLGSTTYTKGVDMWSVGCIIGELLSGKPMFPGTSTMNQIDRILEITGTPSEEDIEAINSPFASTMLGTLNQTKPKDLREVFPNVSEDILDLLRKTLQFNPNKRITAEEALNHEFVSKFHDPEIEPSAPSPIIIPIDDDKKLSIIDYRNALYRDVIDKKKSSKSSSSGSSSTPTNGTSTSTKTSSSSKDKVGSRTSTSSKDTSSTPETKETSSSSSKGGESTTSSTKSSSTKSSSSKSSSSSKVSKEEKERLKKLEKEKKEEKRRLKKEEKKLKEEEKKKKKETSSKKVTN
eukprot:TRINITY_DN485_c0_g1_i2.p1 TRINITY_DN485_c0_g1~~TRINITY_DN485_c0_g1_i2.p1  ORF type:complete len:460 (-),score=184.20 TRINITY_DN485_c0_g1_i2:146-1525(-)